MNPGTLAYVIGDAIAATILLGFWAMVLWSAWARWQHWRGERAAIRDASTDWEGYEEDGA